MNAYRTSVASSPRTAIRNARASQESRSRIGRIVSFFVGFVVLAAAVVMGAVVANQGTSTPTTLIPSQVSVYRAPAPGVPGID